MSNVLRNPWLANFVYEKLVNGIVERDGGTAAPGRVLDTIGPLGELQFPGDKFKPLQVIDIVTFEHPITAILSDKSTKITCTFSSPAESEHEASYGSIIAIKGGIIKPKSYELQFPGADGKLFWKGVTYQNQIAGEPISRKTSNQAKQDYRNSTGSSKPIANLQGVGNTKSNFKNVPAPEPVLYITSFDFLGSTGSGIWGAPTSISSKQDIKNLLTKLPRKRHTKEEAPVGLEHNNRSMGTPERTPLQGNRSKGPRGQSSGDIAQEFLRKSPSSKPSKHSPNTAYSDDEIRSQLEISSGEEKEEESQLTFATQAPGRFSSTYDDLEFSTQAGQKRKAKTKATTPLTSPLQGSPFQSMGHSPQVVIITNSQQNKKNLEFHQTEANVEKKPSIKSKFINYSDGTGLGGSTAGSIANESESKGVRETTNYRNKHKPGQHSPPPPKSNSVSVGARSKGASLKVQREPLASRGWQGMTGITKADTVIPEDQQELLDRPESWYPYQNNQSNQYTSGYSLVSKVQPVPKSHPPRDRVISPAIQIIVPAVPSRPPSISSSDDEEIPWPSSPVRLPEMDINAMPPDSSMPSASQSCHAGRWSTQSNQQYKGRSMKESSPVPQQKPTPLEAGCGEEKNPPVGPPSSAYEDSEGREEVLGCMVSGKRVTRAANGISKKAPVDPNNVESTRTAKGSQRPKASVARKRQRAESEPEAEEPSDIDESSEDELINDPDLPFKVVNPRGRTRVAKFGGILKAQQVEMWEKQKQKKKTRDSHGSTEDEMQSSCDSQVLDEELGCDDESGEKRDDLRGVVESITEPGATKLGSASDEKQIPRNAPDASDYLHNPPGSENDLMDIEKGKGEEQTSKTVPRSHRFEVVEPLPQSKPHHTTTPEVEKDETLEKPHDPPVKRPLAKQTGISTDDYEILQAPLVPLNIMKNTKTRAPSILRLHSPDIDRPGQTEGAKTIPDSKLQIVTEGCNNSPKFKGQSNNRQGDNRGAVMLSENPTMPAMLDALGSRNSIKTPTSSSLPSSASNTAPTIQVEETPYRKNFQSIDNSQCSSPTVSKSLAGLRHFRDEFDDMTLIPGTNTEELQNSSASAQICVARQSALEQDSSHQKERTVPLNHILSSADINYPDDDFHGDLAMSQQQLQREMQQHIEIEVPATSEADDVRIEDAQSQPIPSRNPSEAKRLRQPIKSVDFQSQEIRAANEVTDVSSMLEQQKKQFLGSRVGCDFDDLDFQKDYSPPMNKTLSGKHEVGAGAGAGVSKIPTPANVPEAGNSLARVMSIRNHGSAKPNNENATSDISQSNIRKRHQAPPPGIPKPAKKVRADDKSTHETDHRPSSVPPHAMQDKVEISTRLQGEPSSIAVKGRSASKDKDKFEYDDSMTDIMAGFPIIGSPADNEFEPTLPPQTPLAPEIYAGIRERQLYVPGYGKLTDDQKRELDERRREYFGITPYDGTKALFATELQRAMRNASSSPLSRKKAKGPEAEEVAETADNQWYRDENTPLKLFYKRFKGLKQVKAELTTMESRVSDDNGGNV